MFQVTNTSRPGSAPSILHDRRGRAIEFAAGQTESVDLDEKYARRLHARGGKWKVEGSSGGEGKRVELRETGDDASGFQTTQQAAKELLDKAESMTAAELKEAAKEFLDPVPTTKKETIEELEKVANS